MYESGPPVSSSEVTVHSDRAIFVKLLLVSNGSCFLILDGAINRYWTEFFKMCVSLFVHKLEWPSTSRYQ